MFYWLDLIDGAFAGQVRALSLLFLWWVCGADNNLWPISGHEFALESYVSVVAQI